MNANLICGLDLDEGLPMAPMMPWRTAPAIPEMRPPGAHTDNKEEAVVNTAFSFSRGWL